jgi:TolB protein
VCSLPSWSPDGKRIVFSDGDTRTGDQYGGGEIYTMNPDGSLITPVFQSETTINLFPEWSTDGKKIIFTSNMNSSWGVWSINPDGTNLTQVIGGTKGFKYSFYGIDCSHCALFNQ